MNNPADTLYTIMHATYSASRNAPTPTETLAVVATLRIAQNHPAEFVEAGELFLADFD